MYCKIVNRLQNKIVHNLIAYSAQLALMMDDVFVAQEIFKKFRLFVGQG
jgi:hypothetical protein